MSSETLEINATTDNNHKTHEASTNKSSESANLAAEEETTNVINDNQTSLVSTSSTDGLSKKQRKKLIKLQQWEVKKQIKRKKEREKYKEKRLAAIEAGIPYQNGSTIRKLRKRNKVELSSNKLQIVIDLDFDDLMIYKDICKCVKQLLWIYTMNRKSLMPAHLHYTGIQIGGRIERALERNNGYRNWDVNITNESYLKCFDKDKIIYLTSDSETVLEKLDMDYIYIIGGLVDHNHHKGLCWQRAQNADIKTARLPLSEFISIKTRTVLTIVHVFDILLKVSEGYGWQEAILKVLPMRKGAKPKSDITTSTSITDQNDDRNSFELYEYEVT